MNFPVFQGWNVVVPGPKRAMAIWNHQRWRGRVASESKGCVLFVEVTNIQSFRYVEIQYKLEGFLVGYQSWFSWDESGFIAMKLETREMYTGLYVWFVGIFIGSLRVKSTAPTSFFLWPRCGITKVQRSKNRENQHGTQKWRWMESHFIIFNWVIFRWTSRKFFQSVSMSLLHLWESLFSSGSKEQCDVRCNWLSAIESWGPIGYDLGWMDVWMDGVTKSSKIDGVVVS